MTATKPTDITPEKSWFDRFATRVSAVTSRPVFFFCCLLLVLSWLPSYPVFGNVDTWQLVLNSPTTAITFLLVALTQNSQKRADQAVQHKLNAIAQALAHVMSRYPDAENDIRELRAAVGLEDRESS